ncbi:MAG: hypothetical protein IT306_18005 [Chloroflexi bacterium]|nr:hypothetical protein [Chloroflexota bacterium]
MSLSSRWALLHGAPEPPPDRIPLRAGPLSMILEGGDLRYVRYGDVEVLRRVYVAVRDRNWRTPPMTVSDLQVQQTERAFTVAYVGQFREREIDFLARVRILGSEDGTVRFELDGEAQAAFQRNRIGICVLHPIESCAGRPFQARKVDGRTEMSAFPKEISAHQPVKDLGRISHEILPGLTANVQFEGDTFEMEDQRNWTDASYKIYGTPLRLPFPVQLQAGDGVQQAVTLSLATTAFMPPRGVWPPDLGFTVTDEVAGPLPAIGLIATVADDAAAMSPVERDRLRALNLAYLRVDVNPSDIEHSSHLRRAAADADVLGVPLEIALHLKLDADGEFATLERLLRMVRPNVCRWLVFDRTASAVTDSDEGRALLQRARRVLGALAADVPIVSGTNANFTELNRGRPPLDLLDGVTYAMTPQVHAFDDTSAIETLVAQGWTVESARRFVGEQPLHAGPVTLRQRFNAVATAPELDPLPGERNSRIDPRQASLMGAAWTVGSLAALAPSGVRTITYYETLGWRGVLERATGAPDPVRFPSLAGGVYPLYHVLADVGELAGGEALRCQTTDALRVMGLAIRRGAQTRVLLANLTPERLRIPVSGLSGEWLARRLDEHTARRALAEPERFRAEEGVRRAVRNGRLEVELLPYAVARLDRA